MDYCCYLSACWTFDTETSVNIFGETAKVIPLLDLSCLKNRTYAVLGLGRSGLSAVKALSKAGGSVFCWDDKPVEESLKNEVATWGAHFMPYKDWPWASLEGLLMSPGIPHQYPRPHPCVQWAKEEDIPLTSDLDLLHEAYPYACHIGITGTNGKTTTTSFIESIISAAGISYQTGGNIGTGVCELSSLSALNSIYLQEVSSYQLDISRHLSFKIAVCLNIAPDHIVRHGSFENYAHAKEKIFEGLAPGGTAFIGVDDLQGQNIYKRLTDQQKEKTKGHFNIIPFSGERPLEDGMYISGNGLWDHTGKSPFKVMNIPQGFFLSRPQNAQNIVAAYGVSKVLGIPTETFLKSFKSFKGFPHRQEQIRQINDITFINDSKATNVAAAQKALDAFPAIFWIAGGREKGEDLLPLTHHLQNVQKAYLYGEAAESLQEILSSKIQTLTFKTLEECINEAFREASRQKSSPSTILLSPSFESFDQFKGFEDRGNFFKAHVQSLPH